MNLHLWFRLFLAQMLFLLTLFSLFVATLVWGIRLFTYQEFIAFHVWGLPLYLVFIAGMAALSLIFSGFMMVELMGLYEHIRAKINWLLLGKYQHAIFAMTAPSRHWYDPHTSLSEEINHVRDKMFQLSKDLQEFSAAPIFVGQDTKEEIIEGERHRIARELHDSVSQQLFAAMMMISAVNEQLDASFPNQVKQQINMIENAIGSAQTEMRALLLHLRPVELANKSLKKGLEQLLIELQSKVPLQISWKLTDTYLESGIEDHLFRISQEAISNTLRHAKAEKLELYLSQSADSVNLKIMDDGVGFEEKDSHTNGRYGLMNIRERVTNMGGSLKIMSRKNQGTVIDITVPSSHSQQIKEDKTHD